MNHRNSHDQRLKWFSLILMLLMASQLVAATIAITDEEMLSLARQVELNETGGEDNQLLWWNPGETFASVGMGHFLWMPVGYEGAYASTFQTFLHYAHDHGVDLPDWLASYPPCPWGNREIFLAARDDPLYLSLIDFLIEHPVIQAQFMLHRLQGFIAQLNEKTAFPQRVHIALQIYRLTTIKQGVYVLTDYLNFKGEGMTEAGEISQAGWGLSQVLMEMRGVQGGERALEDFQIAAKSVLLRRIARQPVDVRWKNGWMMRIGTYKS